MKSFIWIGAIAGSVIGGAVPELWGGSMLSVAGLVLSAVGGIAGIFIGYKVWDRFGTKRL